MKTNTKQNLGIYDGEKTGVIYFTQDETHIYAEIAFNAGTAVIDAFEKDDCFSVDENLQEFINQIEANTSV